MEGWSAIDKVMPYAHAVGRVSNGKGSVILIAVGDNSSQNVKLGGKRSNENDEEQLGAMGLVLTTSHVLGSCEEAMDRTVTFLEKPVAGTAIQLGREPRAFSVSLRGDRRFVSSMKQRNKGTSWKEKDFSTMSNAALYNELNRIDDEEEDIGYSMTYLDMYPSTVDALHHDNSERQTCLSQHTAAQNVDSLHLIKPLPLPLLFSKIPPVKVGDAHLMVTHINGLERSYVALKVLRVHEDYCEYETASFLCDFSSGGATFDMMGNFIGLQHQFADQCIALFTQSIVSRLFQADLLGLCCCPISSLPLAVLQEGGMSENERNERFNQPFSILQSNPLMDVSFTGNQLMNFGDIERSRARATSALASRIPSFEEVYEEFYVPNRFDSLLHMLFAFWYNSELTRRVLERMMAQEYTALHPTVATSGGIGVLMELIDGHAEDAALVERCLAALTLLCLHFCNLSVFIQVKGILTVMEVMSSYIHHSTILQWGVHCVMSATDPSQTCEATASVELFLRMNGLDLSLYALKEHGASNRNLTSWVGSCLHNVLLSNSAYVSLFHQKGLTYGVVPFIEQYRSDRLVLCGLLPFFSSLVVASKEAVEGGGLPRAMQPTDVPIPPFAAGEPDTAAGRFVAFVRGHDALLDILRETCESEMSQTCSSSCIEELFEPICDLLAVYLECRTITDREFWKTVEATRNHLRAVACGPHLLDKYDRLLLKKTNDEIEAVRSHR